ncbi:endo alpha-1,4 polygalactosaminidase [Hydrogenivirga caldilitoris]|nr:endo alpha-1,4 polygalactosaminidase [Hydrogenivirga caldilitoris]
MEVIKNKSFYLRRNSKLIGYISVGEIEKFRNYYEDIKKYAIGKNPVWDSYIADLRKEGYVNYILDVVAKRIADSGFDGFFLDTLDSYKLAVKPEEYVEFERAEVELIKNLRARYPDKLIILNRGEEILERVHNLINGVVAESLFRGLGKEREYGEVTEEERGYLLKYLSRAKSYGLPVVVIDYADPKDRKLAKELVSKIKALGFIPYVADRELSRIGHSECDLIPRRVILLYDSSVFKVRQVADVNRLIQMPLEYLGFIPEIYDVNEELPEVYPEAGYLGVVSMGISHRSVNLDRWLLKAKEEGLRLFFIEDFPFSNDEVFKSFGLKVERNRDVDPSGFRVKSFYEGAGFEVPLILRYTDRLIKPIAGKALVVAQNSLGQEHVPFALTNWGGYAVDGSLLNDEELWVYNPFEIFRMVFLKDPFPALDVTTENGRRILTAHIDGDAFFGNAEFSPNRNLGEVIRDEVIKAYGIPHTVSLIEADVAPYGLYPDRSEKLRAIAKSIFSLPNVEPASHSFSHPFTWQTDRYSEKKLQYGYNLPVKGYSFDPVREIKGSVEFINQLLEETGKKVKVFQWTGSCDPDGEEVELTYKLGIFNVNGGDTTVTEAEPFLRNISPMGVNFGPYFQVYAPIQNENVYTNLWTGPFWGYMNVIQTFKLTDKPYRLKPISIYYHFYSAQKQASLNALKRVYEYALSERTNPMFLSEFAAQVLDFRETALLKEGNGFRIKNSGHLRTLRVDRSMGYPDLRKSKGVIGFYERGNDIYVNLDGTGNYYLEFTKEKVNWFNLEETNGQVESAKRENGRIHLAIRAYVPLEVKLDTGPCNVSINGKRLPSGLQTYKGGYRAEIEAVCHY